MARKRANAPRNNQLIKTELSLLTLSLSSVDVATVGRQMALGLVMSAQLDIVIFSLGNNTSLFVSANAMALLFVNLFYISFI